jgi:hypothetical protein
LGFQTDISLASGVGPEVVDILFGVPPPGPLLAPPDIDIPDFTVLDQSSELIHGNIESFCGFLAIQ